MRTKTEHGCAQMPGVTEFVIMSGPEVHDYLVTIRAQLRAYLSAAFPDYRFSLLSQDGEGMGFVVVPVVGSVGGDDVAAPLDPNYTAIDNIRRALEAFRPTLATLH